MSVDLDPSLVGDIGMILLAGQEIPRMSSAEAYELARGWAALSVGLAGAAGGVAGLSGVVEGGVGEAVGRAFRGYVDGLGGV
ncbi:hypothetical protein AB0G02_34300, partial [Actinosynnema sp. NPDC023658]|uniref:hypothetical protein n=1 Tax=Actinosynnema sp. NPDC023658 TaxID=3155465 RepID=UPI003402AE6C